MDPERLRRLLEAVQQGDMAVEEAVQALRSPLYADLGFARPDLHRALRKGFPEVIFGPGKTPHQAAAIAQRLAERSDRLLITRATPQQFQAVLEVLPDAQWNETARAIVVDRRREVTPIPGVAVVCAGTADVPVAEEAALTASLMDCQVERFYDVGVAGIHRLLDVLPALHRSRALVVVAGMEGALPSVVGGLVPGPVIAVPTSVGYGASFRGLAALLAMLNSCAPGVAVVNIDNGFGAGYLAALIARLAAGRET
jgi:NCAIR mutase (PurE)-related protein